MRLDNLSLKEKKKKKTATITQTDTQPTNQSPPVVFYFPGDRPPVSRQDQVPILGRTVESNVTIARHPFASSSSERRFPPINTAFSPHQPGSMFSQRSIRMRLQYSSGQMSAAMADVYAGKLVRNAAKDHGVPLRSLYHRLKMRSTRTASDKQTEASGTTKEDSVEDTSRERLQSEPDADSP